MPEADHGLVVSRLRKEYPGHKERVVAVHDVSFVVAEGSFFTLLGPSGCGKTTTMRCVAGLERPESGSISVSSTRLSGDGYFLPTSDRPIGMVFQSYAVWPHMTVFENVAFPLRVSREKIRPPEIRRRVTAVLELVDLAHLAKRDATQMSGGQQQRLALARALVREPRLLLLDEPLSNLDAKLRERLRGELRSLQRTLGLTTLYVTHDQAEALSMSDQVAVMEHGRISQLGTPRELYERPATEFTARFVGTSNFIEGIVQSIDGGVASIASGLGADELQARCADDTRLGSRVTVSIRPELATVATSGPVPGRGYVSRIEQVLYLGDRQEVRLRVGDEEFLVYAPADQTIDVGREAWLLVEPQHCTVLRDSPGVAAEGAEVRGVTTDKAPDGEPVWAGER